MRDLSDNTIVFLDDIYICSYMLRFISDNASFGNVSIIEFSKVIYYFFNIFYIIYLNYFYLII